MKVFLAHTKREPDQRSRNFARLLSDFLTTRGISVTLDELSFHAGRSIAEEMVQAIYASDKFVLIATPKTLASEYVRTELQHARQRAIDLNPKPFIHVVSLANTASVDFLPKDLRAFLCHVAHRKSSNRLLYEVFFGLLQMPLGRLLAGQLQYSGKSDLVMLERYHRLDVTSPNGDTTFTTERTIQNLGTSDLERTNQFNFWAYGKTSLARPEVKAWLDTGEELTGVEVTRRKLRGRATYTVSFAFPNPIPPDEVVRFRTERFYPKAFDLQSGDTYTLACDDRGYGLLRVEIVFPRDFAVETPVVTLESKGKLKTLGKMEELGSEKFTFSKFMAAPGERFLFSMKARSRRRPR